MLSAAENTDNGGKMSETEMINQEINSQNTESSTSPEFDYSEITEKQFNPLTSLTTEAEFEKLELDDESFKNLLDKAFTDIKEDELVRGKIVNITKDEVFVDIGFKSVGVVPKSELLNAETLKVGDVIDVYIDTIEDPTGKLILSRRRADFMRIWEDILNLYNKQEVVPVRILRRIKGGMVVDLLGIEAFLPGSQIDIRPVRDFDGWVGKTIDVRVVKVNHPSENVVVSHKVLLEEQLSEQRSGIISKLEKGLVLEGVVKAIADFGVFVDLGGVDGLVHITDLSWGRVTHPSEIVELDQVVKVVILDFDHEKRRISLSMKQLTPHPWDTIGDKYEKGTKVSGKVVSLTDYGAFIEIEKGIEGLIHISEMSWTQHVKHPSQVVSMGQVVDAIVLNIDKDEKKLALGMKQLEPDPWDELMKKYPLNSRHRGIVRNLTNFGVFVELEPGVDGLVHISDLSWTKKIRHPGEFVKKGEELEVMVIGVDSEQRRIALGHKQIKENPWDYFEQKYFIGAETEAKIERIIEKGVIVELPDAVDGFVPASQLSFAPVKIISDYFAIGDRLPLKVVEFNKESKKIVLSVVEALRDKERAIIDAYNATHPVPNADMYVNEPPPPVTPEELNFPDEYQMYEKPYEKTAEKVVETQSKVADATEVETKAASLVQNTEITSTENVSSEVQISLVENEDIVIVEENTPSEIKKEKE